MISMRSGRAAVAGEARRFVLGGIARATLAAALLVALTPQLLFADVAQDYRLGTGLYEQGFASRAIPHLERVRKGSPSRVQLEKTLFYLGESYRREGQYSKGADRYGELTRKFSTSRWIRLARLGRGECLVRSDQAKEAVAELEKFVSEPSSDRGHGLYWLAEALARTGQNDDAIGRYRELLRSRPDAALASTSRYNLALLLREKKELPDALEMAKKIDVTELPADGRPRVWVLIGDLSLDLEQPADALAAFSEVRDGVELPHALAGICWAARELDDEASLRRARARLRKDFPKSDELLEADLLYGAWAAERGEVAATDEALRSHLGGERGVEAQFWRGWARLRADQPTEAAATFEVIVADESEWGIRAGYRREGELRRAEAWSDARAAADTFLAKHGDDTRAAEVLAGAVESAYRMQDDTAVLRYETDFQRRFADHDLQNDVTRFAAEAALRSGELDAAVERFQRVLAASPAESAGEVALRLGWALFTRDGGNAARAIQPLTDKARGTEKAELLLLLGRSHDEAGRRSPALAAFRRATEADPTGSAGHRGLLREGILLGSGGGDAELARAESNFTQLATDAKVEEETRELATISLAELLADQGRFEDAIGWFVRYRQSFPTGASAISAGHGLAFSRWVTGDAPGAQRDLASLPDGWEQSEWAPEILFLRGRVRMDVADVQGARGDFEAYAKTSPEGPRDCEVRRALAQLDEEKGDVASAVARLGQLIERECDPELAAEAHYRHAWLLSEQGKPDQAKVGYERLLQLYPRSVYTGEAHFRLGNLAYDAEEYKEARGRYESALRSADSERLGPFARYRIAWSFQHEEAWKQATAAFETVTKQHPESELAGECYVLAADAAGQLDDDARERLLIERFLERHPRHEYVDRSTIRLAELLVADRAWDRIRKLLDPLTARALEEKLRARHRIALGRALAGSEAHRSALTLFEEALEVGEALAAEANFEAGLAHRALGDRDRAIEVLLNGAILYPFEPWAIRSYLEAGRDLIAAKRIKEAKRTLQLAINASPDSDYAKEAKKMLDSLGGSQ